MLALESSSDIANPPPHPANSPCRGRETKQKTQKPCSQCTEGTRALSGGLWPGVHPAAHRPPLAFQSLQAHHGFCKSDVACLSLAPTGGRGGKTVGGVASSPSLAPRGSPRGREGSSRPGGGAGLPAGAGREGPGDRPTGLGLFFRRLSGGRGGPGGRERSLARSGREEGREEAERGWGDGDGERVPGWGKGEASGGAEAARPEAPAAPRRPSAPPAPRPSGSGLRGRGGGPEHTPDRHPRWGGGTRPPRRRNNNEPVSAGGVNPRGPPPRGKTGLPRLPSPAPGPLGGQRGAPGAALTVRASAPPRPRRGLPPHPMRPGVPCPSPAGGPGPSPTLRPRTRRQGVSPRPGGAAGGRLAAGGIPVPLFVSGCSVPPRRLLLRLRLGLATRVSLSLGEKRKCSNSNY